MKRSATIWLTIAAVILVIGGLLMWNARQMDPRDDGGFPELAFEADDNPMLGEEGNPDHNRAMFSGIRKVPADKIQALFPEAEGQPLLIEFKSKFCLDCKRMAPHLEALLPEFGNVQARILDIKDDAKPHAPVFDAFKPSIVPIVVFVNPDGSINNVLYGYHGKDRLAAELRAISQLSALKG